MYVPIRTDVPTRFFTRVRITSTGHGASPLHQLVDNGAALIVVFIISYQLCDKVCSPHHQSAAQPQKCHSHHRRHSGDLFRRRSGRSTPSSTGWKRPIAVFPCPRPWNSPVIVPSSRRPIITTMPSGAADARRGCFDALISRLMKASQPRRPSHKIAPKKIDLLRGGGPNCLTYSRPNWFGLSYSTRIITSA